ncbi:Aldo-keto reductase str7 [Maublancomyces gigas]|uniref:Aldo-keto reductase str7 n=1 Tax=Discina gigas TaxID=1032678 RepID=A0ABR3GJS3_9PEZI
MGKNGPHVAAMGFGLMGLSAFYGAVENDEERFKVLDRAIELGATNWDTSDIYLDSEDFVGKWLKRTGKRDEIFLATKFGFVRTGERGAIRCDPEYVREACESSLKRLGVDSIDLFYAHRMDPKVPIELTVGAMAELVKEGKVKYLGLSECSAATLRRAYAIHPIAAVQVEYSLFFLDIESPEVGLLKACRELGVSVVAYSPLGRGLLTGTIRAPGDFADDDLRKAFPRFSEENFPKILELVDMVSGVAKAKGTTSGQVALAWLMAQGVDIIPIPGTKKIKYLEENVGAVNITLTPKEIKDIRKASNIANSLSGSRYPAG